MGKEELYRFITSKKYGVLASLSAANTPQCALVGIAATRELEIVFDTIKSSRKYGNLIHTPRAAFVIGWDDEITLQYEGEAREPSGDELQHYREVYFAKWPEGRDRLTWPGITHFVVAPRWIRYSDFNEGSREIVEFEF